MRQELKHNIDKILNGEIKIYFVPSFRKALKINNSLGEYKCNKCGNKGNWMGNDLILELEHIDGNRNNNIRENLIWLCPNCHSQTLTFRKNNKKRINKKFVSEDELINSIKKGGNISLILTRVGLKATGDNFNRVHKLIDKMGI